MKHETLPPVDLKFADAQYIGMEPARKKVQVSVLAQG